MKTEIENKYSELHRLCQQILENLTLGKVSYKGTNRVISFNINKHWIDKLKEIIGKEGHHVTKN